jgi:uncharacterized sporulation protein YeaH/YhbH (DUF444 family)
MPRRIHEDHKHFRDVISGRAQRELKRLIKSGQIVRQRGKNGRMVINIPQIDIPHIQHGDNGQGIGRGPGKKGDVIRRDKDQGKSNKPGDEHADGISISVDQDYILKFLQDELHLPDMKPKPNATFEDVKIVYNDISKTGPDSLRHNRRTLLETLKRMAMMQTLDDQVVLPGHQTPMRLITPINSDRRYRQYREIHIPSSNAAVIFARDCSGSMDDYRCDIVSDMAWWIDTWIRKFYEKVDRCYLLHDTECEEVDEKKFYEYRYGGGTKISCVFDTISDLLVNRYPPQKYNIYVVYFSDGDNWNDDNERLEQVLKEKFKPYDLNMVGIVQILPYNYKHSLHSYLQDAIDEGRFSPDFLKLVEIGKDHTEGVYYGDVMPEDERNEQILEGIRSLLGGRKRATR